MGEKQLKTAFLGRVTGVKTISGNWTTRIILFKGRCKAFKQIITLLQEMLKFKKQINKQTI